MSSPPSRRVQSDLAELLRLNRIFFAAKGTAAVEARDKLTTAADAFTKDRLPEVESSALALDETARRKVPDYLRQLRAAATDLQTKEAEASLTPDTLAARYKLDPPK